MFEAAIQYGGYTGSIKDLINLAQNLNCYQLYPGITIEEDFWGYYVEQLCCLDVSDHLQNYIDFEVYVGIFI